MLYPGIGQLCGAIGAAICDDDVVDRCALANKASCVAAVQNDCAASKSDLLKRFDLSAYQADLAPPCVDAIKLAFADAILEDAEPGAIQKACAPTFGEAPPAGGCTAAPTCGVSGEACTVDSACASGFCATVATASGTVGTCTKIIIFSASEAYCGNFQ